MPLLGQPGWLLNFDLPKSIVCKFNRDWIKFVQVREEKSFWTLPAAGDHIIHPICRTLWTSSLLIMWFVVQRRARGQSQWVKYRTSFFWDLILPYLTPQSFLFRWGIIHLKLALTITVAICDVQSVKVSKYSSQRR